MTNNPAPDDLLRSISCKCPKNCGKSCGCRKADIYCCIICINCNENSCTNTPEAETTQIDEHLNNDDDDTGLLDTVFIGIEDDNQEPLPTAAFECSMLVRINLFISSRDPQGQSFYRLYGTCRSRGYPSKVLV